MSRKTRHCEEGNARRGNPLKLCIVLLALILLLECIYCVAVFTDWVPPLTRLRDAYIETALGTMNHKWLAMALIPGDIVREVWREMESDKTAQIGQNSGQWEALDGQMNTSFWDRFPELEEGSVRAWADRHPKSVENGWDHFYVNRSGLDEDGTTMFTRQGDQVLAVDAANGILVLRIRAQRYRGVLILGKDPSRLRCASTATPCIAGQTAGEIAEAYGALAALTASGFHNSAPEGAEQTGASMCGGTVYGEHLKPGYKRIELRSDDRLYVVDAPMDFHPDCTDAMEWTPALIVDGVTVVSEEDHYNALNPRCCLGQAKDGTVLMLCIEGRYFDSLGATAPECAEVLARYGAYQAMNLDGGSSAICWYEGSVITRCADPTRPEGRLLPNVWIYK